MHSSSTISYSAYILTCFRIGKGSSYKSSELESLTEDETLVVGGKEIQVCLELHNIEVLALSNIQLAHLLWFCIHLDTLRVQHHFPWGRPAVGYTVQPFH